MSALSPRQLSSTVISQKVQMKLHTTSLENFPLIWRWTDPKYIVLTEEELSQIQPLDKASAKIVWKQSLEFASNKNDFSPNEKIFNRVEGIDSQNYEVASSWLKEKIPDVEIIVTWQPEFAVITNSNLFIKYWDDFCYPASDDVSIWPENESWILHYWHEEKFWYGIKR